MEVFTDVNNIDPLLLLHLNRLQKLKPDSLESILRPSLSKEKPQVIIWGRGGAYHDENYPQSAPVDGLHIEINTERLAWGALFI